MAYYAHFASDGFQSAAAEPSRRYTEVNRTLQGPREDTQEDNVIYVNEVCMQMDQLMSKCEDHEDLLVLLVTHRGVMYLHNLVTAMNMLQAFAERDRARTRQPDADDLFAGYQEVFGDDVAPPKAEYAAGNGEVENRMNGIHQAKAAKEATEQLGRPQELTLTGDIDGLTETQQNILKKAKEEVLVHFENPANRHYLKCRQHSMPVADVIVRDERFDLLLHDIYENRNKLDVESACQIIIALDALQYKYFRLYNGILRHLMRIPLHDSYPSTAKEKGKLLLKACQCYVRAGFYDSPLYSKVCREIYRQPIEGATNEIDPESLVETLKLFAKVDVYDPVVFSAAAARLMHTPLTANDLSHVAAAYAAHNNYTKTHDEVMIWAANQIQKRTNEFTTLELARCVNAFAGMRLFFPPVYNTLVQRLIDDLEMAGNSYVKMQLTIPQMSVIVHHLANFAPDEHTTQSLIHNFMAYLEEYIDLVDEKCAINLAFAVCATNTHVANPYLLSFLLRIIGKGTEWEQCKYRVFAIWLFHVINFPEISANMPKRCITSGMREWMLRHGNGTQFTAELKDIADILQKDLGLKNITETDTTAKGNEVIEGREASDAVTAISSIDISIEDIKHKIVINENSCRNDTQKPIGVDLVIQNLLRSTGAKVHSVNFQHWLSMNRTEKEQFLRDVLSLS
ncbi:uncharacterized protein BXIN_2335 [Babesia sp. Xinjiang]|uniref:uncharacterized protein n=1 Tax=Babesia sp. Xinjiang TaxID=462227 RepID=UPI000A222136|nr:uncharacterized protein BXIN_2335 [Babesia sp. Xinjiang]ORM40824.1 hypothetical protein BXIN_2335 [Babesia sp. Xinjiang]